jgi:hypothetical protein
MVIPEHVPEQLEELLKLEHRLEREWWWINGALHAAAQIQSDGPKGLRELRTQARTIDRMRVEISVRLAQRNRNTTQTLSAHASRQPL